MSKSPLKNRELHKLPKTALLSQYQSKNKTVVFAIITILAVIPFSMGKYLEFNSPGPYDNGAYVYSAEHILDGGKIGVEEKPTARMGTLLVNTLGAWLCGFSKAGLKLVQTVLQAAVLVLMFIAMRKLLGTFPAAVGVIVASTYLSTERYLR